MLADVSAFEAEFALDALDVGVVMLDAQVTVVGWNDWIVRASGISKQAALGKPLLSIFPALQQTRLPAAINDALQVGSSSILTHTLNKLLPLHSDDGSDLLHNVVVRPVSSGRSICCLLQISDVTVSVARERVLRDRQNARYHAIVNSARDAIITTGTDRTIHWVNGAAEQAFGYGATELLGQPIDMLLERGETLDIGFAGAAAGQQDCGRPGCRAPQDRRACDFRRLARPMEGGRPRLHDDDLARCDRATGRRGGHPRKRSSPSRLAGGLAATGLDLPRRRELRLLQSAVAGLHRSSGRTASADGPGSTSSMPRIARVWSRRGGCRWRTEACSTWMPVCAAPTARIAGSSCARSRCATTKGEIARWFGTATEITDLVEARETLRRSNDELEAAVVERTREREVALKQLHEAQKMESIGQLTGGVAHDFNNLLAVILGSLALLRKNLPEDPRTSRLIDGAIQGAERGANLTRRLLAFARRQELKLEAVEIAKLVPDLTDFLRQSVGPGICDRFRCGARCSSGQNRRQSV